MVSTLLVTTTLTARSGSPSTRLLVTAPNAWLHANPQHLPIEFDTMLLFFVLAAFGTPLTVDMLDVGQGDSLLITTPNGRHILVDAGTRSSGVADTLHRLGVNELDLVIATHPHADHIGGMREVVSEFPIGAYMDSGMEHTTRTYQELMDVIDERNIEYRVAREGQHFALAAETNIQVLWPRENLLRNTRSDLNSNSVVLRIEHGDDCMLLTGDAEEPTEAGLLRQGLETCDVLKVAHHGSRHSSTRRFVDAVSPSIAIISLGEGNRYHHPGDSTIRNLQAVDATIYRTDLTGHLSLEMTGEGVVVTDGLAMGAPTEWRPPATEPSPSVENSAPTASVEPDTVTNTATIPTQAAPPIVDEAPEGFCSKMFGWFIFWD